MELYVIVSVVALLNYLVLCFIGNFSRISRESISLFNEARSEILLAIIGPINFMLSMVCLLVAVVFLSIAWWATNGDFSKLSNPFVTEEQVSFSTPFNFHILNEFEIKQPTVGPAIVGLPEEEEWTT